MRKLGLINKSQRVTLEMYCVMYGRWRKAEKQAKSIMKKSKKGTYYYNPYLAVADRAVDRLIKLGNELGLSPKSFYSLKDRIDKPKKKVNKDTIFNDSA